MNMTIEFRIFELVLVPSAFLFLIFWTKFSQKENFHSKKEKVNITIKFGIFKFIKVRHFIQNRRFFWTRLAQKGCFRFKKEKRLSFSNSAYSD